MGNSKFNVSDAAGHEKPFVKHRRAYSVKLVVSNVVKGIQIKITAKFRDTAKTFVLKIKRELCDPKNFGTFEKRAPGVCGFRTSRAKNSRIP